MTQQLSPWIEGAYGWNFGEGGWNSGMDQNLLKFSFLFDRNVDSIVASLPPAINGQAHYLTTDNRLYFAVGNTYFSTVVPKWFTIVVRATGATWQYNGSALVQIENATDIDTRLDAVELTIASLGTAAFEDISAFATATELDIVEAQSQAYTDVLRQDLLDDTDSAKGVALVARASISIGSVSSGFFNQPVLDGRAYIAESWHAGASIGGGIFYGSPSDLKSLHDGAFYISPTVPAVEDQPGATLADKVENYLSGLGETDPSGSGVFVRVDPGYIAPSMFGAVADGVSDDGGSINASFSMAREILTTRTPITSATVLVDFEARTYLTTISLNATGLSSWGWSIENGTIIGECVGKSVLDMVGSRGGNIRNLTIYGRSTAMPSIGIQVARSTGTGRTAFCDNTLHDNVTVFGYYSLASVYFYAQETTTYNHCRWWNANPDGYAALLMGSDIIAPVTSDYLPVVTGSHSYINNKYINCDIRFLPEGNSYGITGITNGVSPIVSAAGHTFVNGDVVTIGLIASGMTQINNLKGTVSSSVPGVSFALTGVDSTSFTAYTTGGQVVKSQTLPTVVFGRGEQHYFDTCYIVNYGSDSVEIRFPDSNSPEQITFDCLFEGIGSRSHIRFANGAGQRDINDFVLRTYNTHCRDYVISSNTSGGAFLRLQNAEISVTSTVYNQPLLFDVPVDYRIYDADIYYPHTAGFLPLTFGAFVGKVSFTGDLSTTIYNNKFISSLDQTYTPVVTSTIGAITSYTATGRYKKVGALAFISIDITITTNGTAAGAIVATLPELATVAAVISGRNITVAGKMLQAQIGTSATVYNYDNTYPGSDGSRLIVSGVYLTA